MNEKKITLKDILEENCKYSIIAGAGCSKDAPSNLPTSVKIMEEIIKFTCAQSEIENISNIEGLRFEFLLEIIRNLLDNDLKILKYLEQCDEPNFIHYFLTEMIYNGHYVITTNFDFLIEHAIIQSNRNEDSIISVITESDYRQFENIFDYLNAGKKFLFKIHGSTKDILADRNTKDYFISLIKKIGSYKSEFNLFSVEPYKGVLFNKLLNKAIIILIGYSGLNDFDIIPILKKYHKMKRIIWINHIDNDGDKEKINEIFINREKSTENLDDLDKILLEIKNQNPNIELFRIDTNLKKLLNKILDFEFNSDKNNRILEIDDWLNENIEIPDMGMKYLIPHVIYFNFDRFEDSFRCGISALEHIPEKSRNNHKELILNNIGWIYYKMGNYSEAIEHFEEAVTIAHKLDHKDRELIYLSNLGEINERIRNYPVALQRYEDSIKIAEEVGNLMEKLRIMNSVIEIHEELQNYTEALSFSEEAIKISEKLGDLKKKAIIINNIASIHFKQQNLNLALDYFQQSEKIFRRLNDIENLTVCLNNIGTIFQKFEDFSFALDKFKEALEYDERLNDKEGKARHLCKIGEVNFDQNNYTTALNYFREAIEFSRELKDTRSEMEIYNWIGKTLYYLREYNNALDSFNNGLKIAEKLNNLTIKADFLNNIAGCYYMQLNYKESYRYAQESLLILKLTGMGKSVKSLALEAKLLKIKNQINS
ncbi:MAG: tetratricopeptide repeat protein [Promethearchaeota archaeon]